MGWSTSVIAPPDGDMAAYMASLDKLLARPDSGLLADPRPGDHRAAARMSAPSSRIAASARPASSIASNPGRDDRGDGRRLYVGLNPGLRRAAGRSVQAHLIDLIARDIVASDGPPAIDAIYRKSGS